MTFTTFSLSTIPLSTRAAAQPVLTTTAPSMSSFAAIPILGYSILALIFSYIVQRLIRIVNFRNLLSRSSSATSSSSETLPTNNAVPSENKKSSIPLPSWDLTPFKRTTANAYRKASSLVLPSRDSVELLPTHVASPPPTAALVDYGVYTETPLNSASTSATPPLTSSPTPSLTSTTSPRTPSPAHHSPFSIPLRVPLPTPFSLFPGPYVPLQPQPLQNGVKGSTILSPTRARTPSPPSHHPLATTPPPTTAHRRSKSLGGVPVRKVAANSKLGLGLGYAFPTHDASAAVVFPHAEVEMRDLYPREVKDKGKDSAPLIDFSSSSEGEEEVGDDEDVGVFGRKSGSGDSLVPGGPLEMVAMPLVDLSDTRGGEEDVFGFKNGVVMMSRSGHGKGRRSSSVGNIDQNKRGVELLPLNRNAAKTDNTLIDIDASSMGEEKLVDVDASSSSKTISPIEPVVLSAVPSRVVSREASPIPVVAREASPPVSVPVEPLVHLPVVQMQKNLKASVHAPVEVFAPVSVSVLDEAVAVPVVAAAESVAMPVVAAIELVESREEEGGEELVHVAYEEEDEGVLVDVSPRPVDDGEVSLPEVAAEVVDVEVSRPEAVDVEVSRPVDVEASAPAVVEVSFPKTTDVLVDVDVDASPEPKPTDDQNTNTTSEQKPTAWQWDEEDDMMRAWSLGLDLVEAPLPLDVTDSDVQVAVHGSPHPNESLPDEKLPYDLLLTQQDPTEPSPPPTTTSVEDSPPLPLLPPLTIPLITISDTKRDQEEEEEEEYPDPGLLPLPDFSSTKEEEKEKGREHTPPSQTPTPPDSPPPSSPGGLGVVKSRTAPSSPRSPALRPAWSLRAADAPPLGLSSSSSSGSLSSTPVASPSVKKGGVVLKEEEGEEEQEVKVQEEEEETDKIKLSETLPGSFPDSQAPSSSSDITITTTTTPPDTTSIKALTPSDTGARIRVSRSPLDIALAMQLRPGLGVGADPAWMVRFLMAMFGWFAILVSGQGEF